MYINMYMYVYIACMYILLYCMYVYICMHVCMYRWTKGIPHQSWSLYRLQLIAISLHVVFFYSLLTTFSRYHNHYYLCSTITKSLCYIFYHHIPYIISFSWSSLISSSSSSSLPTSSFHHHHHHHQHVQLIFRGQYSRSFL